MKKIFILLGLLVTIICNAQLIRPVEYKGMPAYYWRISDYKICSDCNTTTFELYLYFNTSTYMNEGRAARLDMFPQVVTIDSIVKDDTATSTYQLIKDNSEFFKSSVIATSLQYNSLSITQAISDTIIDGDTIQRSAVVKNAIHDVKGKVLILSLLIEHYKDGVKISTSPIHMVVDNMFKFDGTGANEYDYFIQNMFDNDLSFDQAIRQGILYADAYGIINAKLKGLR